jgi:hypothetical protein
MYHRILVPIDGSATAQRGLQEAMGLAKTCDASLVLLHVVEAYPMMMEMATATTWEQVTTDLRAHGQRVLEAAHQAARDAGIASEARLEDAVVHDQLPKRSGARYPAPARRPCLERGQALADGPQASRLSISRVVPSRAAASTTSGAPACGAPSSARERIAT